jgi:4-amino-4-deoxy-L-arabinose transferase-like glycosyltransferase
MDCPSPPPSRSLPAWLPFLWSHVLFPGDDDPAGRWRWRSLALLILLPALLLYPCMTFPLLEPDESRYAEIPREMLHHGDLIVPRLQGEPYLDKPPMLYWLIAGSYRLFGVHDGAARLPSALAVHLCILLTYLFGRRIIGERGAMAGALLLTLAPGFVSVGRLLLLDGVLALWTTLALFSGFEAVRGDRLRRGWWLLAAVACGLGVLTKGPVALVLLVPPLWLHRWLTGRGCRVKWPDWLAFLGVLSLIALPWYVVLCLRLPEFARHFFWEHHVVRFLSGMAHLRGFWFYGPVLLFGLLPGTLLLWPFVRFLFAADEETARQRGSGLGFLLLGGGWCVLFFTLSACKLPTYILPAFPPLALALGCYLAHSRWHASRTAAGVGAVAFLLLGVTHHVWLPWYAGYRSPMNRPEAVQRLCTDPETPVVCYPRNCDSVAFYLGRADLRNYRSQDIELLRDLVRRQPRTVILCTHRHSLRGLKQLLPPEVHIVEEVHLGLRPIPGVSERLMGPLIALMGETAHGLCDLAVIERAMPHAVENAERAVPRSGPEDDG